MWPLNKLKAIFQSIDAQLKAMQENQDELQQKIASVHEKAQQNIAIADERAQQNITSVYEKAQQSIIKANQKNADEMKALFEQQLAQVEKKTKLEIQELQKSLTKQNEETSENNKQISAVRKEVLDVIEEKGNFYNDKFYHADINYIDAMFHLCDSAVPNNSKRYAELKDKHKGEKCFIIGNGPSLKMEDLEVLRKNNITTFAVNRIYLAFDKVQWRPTYYMCQDYLAIENFWQDIVNNFKATPCFFPYQIITENHKNLDGMDAVLFPFKIINAKPAWFSYSTGRVIHEGMTVVFSAMQLAEYMGFSEVYFIGLDFSYATNKNENGNEEFDRNKKSHFADNYFQKEYTIYDPQLDVVKQAYESALEYSKTHDIKFYNATRGGNLETFKRVNFDEIFSEKQ